MTDDDVMPLIRERRNAMTIDSAAHIARERFVKRKPSMVFNELYDDWIKDSYTTIRVNINVTRKDDVYAACERTYDRQQWVIVMNMLEKAMSVNCTDHYPPVVSCLDAPHVCERTKSQMIKFHVKLTPLISNG